MHSDRDGHFLKRTVFGEDAQAEDIVAVGDKGRVPDSERGIRYRLGGGLEGEPGVGRIGSVRKIQPEGGESRDVRRAGDGHLAAYRLPGGRRRDRNRRGILCGEEEQNQG